MVRKKVKNDKNRGKPHFSTHEKDRKYDTILGINIDSSSAGSLLSQISSLILAHKKFLVVTPNPEIIMRARHDAVLHSILNSADISLPDGVGLVWASRWQAFWDSGTAFFRTGVRFFKNSRKDGSQAPPAVSLSTEAVSGENVKSGLSSDSFFKKGASRPLARRVSGVDTMEKFVELASKRGWRVFLLGGQDDVAAQAQRKLLINHQSLIITHDSGPWLDENGEPVNASEAKKEQEVIKKINEFKPQLLFVGFGFPKQEKWSARNMNRLHANCIMVVGGSFNFISGRITRAPKFMRDIGLEWLFRLIIQPWRIKRQTALLKFVWAVLTRR